MTNFTKTPPTVLVSGAAGATGRAIAQHFAHRGAAVALLDVDQAGLGAVAAEIEGKTALLTCDIADADRVQRAVSEAEERLGRIDVLVNNAGILSNNKIGETDDLEWRRVLGVNLDGAFYLARAVLPGMRQKGYGRIVNICSMAMKTGGLTAGTAYTTSKGALGALTFSLAREAASDGVTVNGIAPAYVRTPMVTEHLSEEERQKLLAQIPVGRFCEPEEIAHLVAFLACEHAGFITGEIIDINGGLHMD